MKWIDSDQLFLGENGEKLIFWKASVHYLINGGEKWYVTLWCPLLWPEPFFVGENGNIIETFWWVSIHYLISAWLEKGGMLPGQIPIIAKGSSFILFYFIFLIFIVFNPHKGWLPWQWSYPSFSSSLLIRHCQDWRFCYIYL